MLRLRTSWDGEEGATAVIVAILVVVLFGFTALAVDAARMYSERRELQSTADASALAGAREFFDSPSDAGAATLVAQEYVAENPTIYHPGGYNEASVASDDLVQGYNAPAVPEQCVVEGVAYDCVISHVEAPERSDEYPQGFNFLFAPVLDDDFDGRAISAEATALIGAGAPGGEKLVPWLVMDCPNPARYPDETAAVFALVQPINPSCAYPDGFPITDDYASGTRVDLFLDSGGSFQGNFQGGALEQEPDCPLVDGLFQGGGGADYRAFLGGEGSPDVVPCTISNGARAYTQTGVLVGPTRQGLDDRGVNDTNCTTQAAFDAAIDPGDVIGDGRVTIVETNPCMLVLLMVVRADPAQEGEWDQDVSGGARIAEWQHPDPLDIDEGRFGMRSTTGKKVLLVRRFGLFYLTEQGASRRPYRGLFMQAVDSSSSELDGAPCETDTAICVVKLVH